VPVAGGSTGPIAGAKRKKRRFSDPHERNRWATSLSCGVATAFGYLWSIHSKSRAKQGRLMAWPAHTTVGGGGVALSQQLAHCDDLLGDLDELLLTAHGLAAHQGVGFFLVAILHFHQQSLGQFDSLAFRQLLVPRL
jgi:hypothetical protein